VSAGDDLYGADAAGQTRSLIVEQGIVIVVRVQNDGSTDDSYSVTATPPAPGFEISYLAGWFGVPRENSGVSGRLDVTRSVLNGTFAFEDVRPGQSRKLVARVTALPGTALGALQDLLVTATSTTDPGQIDAARATITKV